MGPRNLKSFSLWQSKRLHLEWRFLSKKVPLIISLTKHHGRT
jgi:hypothetical protein